MAKKSKMTPTEQSRRFFEKARELGCDEDADAFEKVLKKVTSAPPPRSVQKRKAKKRDK